MDATIIQADASRIPLAAASINCVVTSCPYWGLRDYGLPPTVWGGRADCNHHWVDASWRAERWGSHDDDGAGDKQRTNAGTLGHRGQVREASTCSACGAWLGCLGLEPTPEMFVANMVAVCRELRRVLRDDGTLWLNIGDTYWGGKGQSGSGGLEYQQRRNETGASYSSSAAHVGGKGKTRPQDRKHDAIKGKDLVGIPWMVAFALRADGWYLRQDIIWHKPNPMPESVGDRCTKAHEYIFLLSKSAKYYYDQAAILEPVSANTHMRLSQDLANQIGSHRANGGAKTNGPMKAVGRKAAIGSRDRGEKQNASFETAVCLPVNERNKRSVWTVATQSYTGAHFATFPPKLIEPCIKAGCPEGGIVLDPFGGSGTTAEVALKHGRRCVLLELNPDYIELAKKRIAQAREGSALFTGAA